MSEFSLALFGVTRQCAGDADFAQMRIPQLSSMNQKGRTSQGLTLVVQMSGNRLSKGSMNKVK